MRVAVADVVRVARRDGVDDVLSSALSQLQEQSEARSHDGQRLRTPYQPSMNSTVSRLSSSQGISSWFEESITIRRYSLSDSEERD